MKHASTNVRGLWSSVIAVVVLLALAGWQFYLFVTFKDPNGIVDLQGGKGHLWIAISATLLAFIAGFFILSVFLRYDSDKELHIT